jgi:protocatechuate 3,4-dioxygenase beta subunit
MKIRCLTAFVAFAVLQQPAPPPPSSIEGIVVRQGTNEPLGGVDLELSRVEGTSAAPLAPGVAQNFASLLNYNGPGLPATTGANPPPLLAPEVKYASTSNDGRFTFKDLKEGKYRLTAVRGGTYFPVEFGQRDLMQRGLNFPVAAGQALKDVKLEMIPTGAIAGRVFDEDGQPMGHVVVLALRMQYQAGEQRGYIERQTVTDERGLYRLYWLGPGKYSVAAVYEDPRRRTIDMAPTTPPGRILARYRATSPVVTRQVLPDGNVLEEAYGVVYYGGTVDPNTAATVEVHPGETFSAADIPMGAGKVRSHHIRGVVVNGDSGQAADGVQVLAIPRQWRPNALVLNGISNGVGEFDLSGAFPEQYILTASTGSGARQDIFGQVMNPGGGSQIGYLLVDMGDSDATVRVVTKGGISLSGHIEIEGRAPSENDPDLAKMSIGLTRDPDLIAMPDAFMSLPTLPSQPLPLNAPPPPNRPRNGQALGNGNFSLLMAPGDFQMSVNGIPANTYVKSIRMGGEDILRSGLHVPSSENQIQIVIGADGGSISGSVIDETSHAVPNAIVALVPDVLDLRKRPDLYRNTVTDSAGTFALDAILPGSYKLFAWEWAPTDSWQNADFIRGFEESGKAVQVEPFRKQEGVQVSVIPGRKTSR